MVATNFKEAQSKFGDIIFNSIGVFKKRLRDFT